MRPRSRGLALLLLGVTCGCGGGSDGDGNTNVTIVYEPVRRGSLFRPEVKWSVDRVETQVVPLAARQRLGEKILWIHGEAITKDRWRPLNVLPGKEHLALWNAQTTSTIIPIDLERSVVDEARLSHPEYELTRLEMSIEEVQDPASKIEPYSYLVTTAGIGLALPATDPVPDGEYLAKYPTTSRSIVREIPTLLDGMAAPVPHEVTLAKETRPAWFLPPPGRIHTSIIVEPGAQLHFGFAMRRAGYVPQDDGILLTDGVSDGFGVRVALFDESGGREVLFERIVGPETAGGWIDASVDFSSWAGRAASLEITTFAGPMDDVRDDLVFVSAPYLAAEDPDRPDPPNVVVVLLDTLRADGLGCYGNTRPLTPNLDAFAKDAVLFEQARSSCSWTLPAHASLFTSLLPTQHLVSSTVHRIPGGMRTLADVLRDAGWRTSAYTDDLYLNPAFGFQKGFDTFNFEAGGVKPVGDRVLEWIDRAPRPFFTFFHTYEVHDPYTPPEPFRSKFVRPYQGPDPAKVLEALRRGETPDDGKPSAEHIRILHDLYEAEIAYTDHVLGQFFADLKARDLWENTLVIVTSDHGEEFFEHGGFTHKHTLYDELLHIPLLVRFPGRFEGGQRIATPVRLVDIAPTIAEITNLPIPAIWQGISLTDTQTTRDVFAMLEPDEKSGKRSYAFLEGLRKWIRSDPGFYKHLDREGQELYDLTVDPREKRNLWNPKDDAHLEEQLKLLLERYPPLTDRVFSELTSDQAAALRAMGY